MAGGAIPPQLAAMLGAQAGGAPGAAPAPPGGAPGAPAGASEAGGLAPLASFAGRMMAQQPDPKFLVDTINKLMAINGELMGHLMHQDPDAYQDILDIQKKLGSAKNKLSKKAQSNAPIQNAVAQLTRMMPGQKPPAY